MPDLDWTLSVPLRRSWAEVCRWITSLAGGSSCRGNVGWLDVAPSIRLSLRLKRHLKWCATAIRVVITFLSVSARRSVELDDDKVVSEYEEDWPEGGIGSAIRVSCPSYLGPSWQPQFLRLLYGGPPQVSFFAYKYRGPPQVSFLAYYRGPPQFSFFAYYMGAPSD